MIKLYGVPRSRSLRVSWMLEELGLDWQYHFINFAKGDSRSEAFLAINPCGKVPALVENDLVITESAAIVLYLAEKYGDGNLLPQRGSNASALHHQWVSFITCELEQPLWTIGKHKFALPEELRQQSMFAVAKWEFDKAAAIAENWLPDSEFLLGDKLSAADILLGHTLLWATRFEQDIPPKLAAYRDRVTSRPAMTKALEKEMAGAE
ncbi:glutathione S-transferase family protein [Shewanella sp. D64]|uniref:glutathione S-transferase family protein n=1 Tax=unclassified Shewanella TaxID=196818 RepID=UPI0022BA3720|nr:MULTISPECIES: glutathione S-transferase family protein [unclassified Shewanella]MEC4728185.1 glutathione S-transferase family protein [Shewanella sp. D64]MEC4739982.1 glutathione S-transferase family protein [Shewanella sp. E94]WBJ94341.1 glutathione S-transferase family protein [Shewanella sp. MTB7]